MRKFVAILLCVIVAFAAIGDRIRLDKTLLRISVVHGEPHGEIVDQVRLLVGYVPVGRKGPPTLGNIFLIRPKPNTTHDFIVPPQQRIGVFAFHSGLDPASQIVQLRRGELREITLVMSVAHSD